MKMWAKDYAKCQVCGTDSIPYEARGQCKYCYHKQYAESHREEIQGYKQRWYKDNVTPEMQKIRREDRNYSGNREEVLRRDKHMCILCGEPRLGKLTVHHKDGLGRNGSQSNNAPSNLETL